MMRPSGFGADFRWGVATAAYQIEGAADLDGRGASVWDTFCAQPGRIKDGDTGDVACDHYHRYREDVALMAGLGVDSYRFSIAWPRIQPTGSGPVNEPGLAFYDRLVDSLLEAGIAPCATLFHWDLPQALQDRGGWLDRDTAQRFAEYAAVVGARLGDRVDLWATLNEPVVVTLYGYALGMHAPGLELMYDALPVAHHQLLGHGLAVQALRAAGAERVGIVNNHAPTWPATDRPVDAEAAALYDDLVNWVFADPVLRGVYPGGFAELMPGPVADDLAVISTPLDWYGLNHYSPAVIGEATEGAPLPFALHIAEGYPLTDFGWAVVPEAFTEILGTLRTRYGEDLPPIYVTENGCSYGTGPGPDGKVHDQARIDYLAAYLGALRTAQEEGSDVRGYFCWSLLDNFEWTEGYSQRFGLVHVDFETQRRTPKDSYDWFRSRIAAERGSGA